MAIFLHEINKSKKNWVTCFYIISPCTTVARVASPRDLAPISAIYLLFKYFFFGRFVPISVKTVGIDEKKGGQRNQNVIDSWWRLGGMVRMVASTCEIAGFFGSFPPPVLPLLLLLDVCRRPSSSLLQSVMSRALGHNNPQNMRMRNGSW